MQKLFENWREFRSTGDVISEADDHDASSHVSLSKIGEELKNKKKESYISGRGAKNLEKLLAEFTKKNKNNLLQDLQRLKKGLDHQRERSNFFKKELAREVHAEKSRYLELEHTKYKQEFESYNKHYQKLNKIYTSIESNDLYRAFGIGKAIVSGLDKLTLNFAKNEEEFNALNGDDRHSKTNTLGTYIAHKYLLTFNPRYVNPKNIEKSLDVIDHELEHAISHIYQEYMMKLVGAHSLVNQPGGIGGRAWEAGTKTRYGKYMEDLIYIADIQLEKLRKIFAGPINPMISQTPSVGDWRKEPELAELIKLGFAQKGTLEGSPDHDNAIKKWKYGKYETRYGKGGARFVSGVFPEYQDRSEELRAYAKEFRNSLQRDVDPEGLRAFCTIRDSLEKIRNTFPQLVKYINKNGYTKAKNRIWREKGRAGPSQSFLTRDLPNLESDIRKWYNYFQKSAQKFPEVKKLLPKKFDIEAIILGRLPSWTFWMGLNCSDADSAAEALNTLAKMGVRKEPGAPKTMIAECRLFNNMKIKRSKLIQIIREEASAVVLGQWTPQGLEAALLRNDTPRKPDDIDDETWKTSIERCLAGEGAYCPLNYGVDKYVRPAPKKRKDFRVDLVNLLKDPSHYKKKKYKPSKPAETARQQAQKIFSTTDADCPLCDIYKAFSFYNAKNPGDMKRSNIWLRKALARELVENGQEELVTYNREGKPALSRAVFLKIVKNNNIDLFPNSKDKRKINTMHNLWQGMNDKQRRWLTKQLYR